MFTARDLFPLVYNMFLILYFNRVNLNTDISQTSAHSHSVYGDSAFSAQYLPIRVHSQKYTLLLTHTMACFTIYILTIPKPLYIFISLQLNAYLSESFSFLNCLSICITLSYPKVATKKLKNTNATISTTSKNEKGMFFTTT